MTRRRFIADESQGDRAALVGDHAAHLSKVLRAKIGQGFDIVSDGVTRRGEISNISNERVEFDLHETLESAASEQRELTLLLAVFKFDRFEWALEKAVELGAITIVPVIARRTEPHLAKAADKRVERWRRIARESSQQSRRSAKPEISSPTDLKTAVEHAQGSRVLLSEHESPQRLSLKKILEADGSGPLTFAIGPEGGWTTDELKLFESHGWQFASLGPTVLRVETATIAALAIALT
jgi:16S rRNA (uracil1498-N3)-methyltransferase